jgi:hypothetical protein
MIQSQRWCLTCGRSTLHGKQTLSCAIGCLIAFTVLILGPLLLPVIGLAVAPGAILLLGVCWFPMAALYDLLHPWRCQICGATGNPSFKPQPPRPRKSLGDLRLDTVYWPALWASIVTLIKVVIVHPTAVFDRVLRTTWGTVERGFLSLPEWAQPIAWALGLAVPPAVVAIGLWTVMSL